jgi:hypothetical protein
MKSQSNRAARVMPLQTSCVLMPILALARSKIRIGKLQDYIFKELREGLANQSTDVLEYECTGAYVSYGTNSLRKKISSVVSATMLAGDREWLTGRPTRYKVDALPLPKVDGIHVCLKKRPMSCRLYSRPLICSDRITRIVIVFDNADVL